MELEQEHYIELERLLDEIAKNPGLRRELSDACGDCKVLYIDNIMAIINSYGYEFYSYEDLPVSHMTCCFIADLKLREEINEN